MLAGFDFCTRDSRNSLSREKARQGFAIKRSRSRFSTIFISRKNGTSPPARVSLPIRQFPFVSSSRFRSFSNIPGRQNRIEAFSKGRGWQFSLPRFGSKTRMEKMDGKIQHFLLAIEWKRFSCGRETIFTRNGEGMMEN